MNKTKKHLKNIAKKILPLVFLIFYYFILLEPAISNINRVLTPNRMHIAIIVFVIFSINGVALSALYTKKYDIIFLLLYKVFSFFLCCYIFAIDDLVSHYQDMVVNIDLVKSSWNIFIGYFLITSEGVSFLIFEMLFFFSLYVAISAIPFILLRIIKSNYCFKNGNR